MAASIFVPPRAGSAFVNGSGVPFAGGQLFFYQTGTTTPQTTYADAGLTTPNANPVIADANGLFGPIYVPQNTSYKVVMEDSLGNTIWTQDPVQGVPINSIPSVGLLQNYLTGLGTTNNGTNKYFVASGSCADDTNAVGLILISATADFTTVGVNGLDTGSLTVTATYHLFAIGTVAGATGLLGSLSVASPVLPSQYIYKRRIRSFRTNVSSQIINDIQDGDYFQFSSPIITDVVASPNPGTTAVLRSLTVPGGINVLAQINPVIVSLSALAANLAAYFSDPATADIAPTGANASALMDNALTLNAAGGVQLSGYRMSIRTNTSSQIRTRISYSDPSSGFNIHTLGWIDRRGK